MVRYAFEESTPSVGPGTYVHPMAVLIGNVTVGNGCFIGAGAVLRADFGPIHVDDGSNVQENCVIHVTPGLQVLIGEDVIVGHGAILHDVTVRSRAVIGMGSTLLRGVVVKESAMVAAGAVVQSGFVVPPRTLVAGNPAKVDRELPEAYLQRIRQGLSLYHHLPERYRNGLRRIED